MTRPAVEIEKRRPLTRREVIELAVRQGGRCACPCGVKLDALREGVTDEHRVPLALGGSNDLANRELWRSPCAKAKTDGKDTPAIAKCKRQAGETGQRARREKRGGGSIPARKNPWPPKGSRKLPTKAKRESANDSASPDTEAA